MGTVKSRLAQSGFEFKPFSKKQKKLLTWWCEGSPHADKDMCIAEGAVRSGKTIAEIDSFITWSTSRFEYEDFIIAGKSMGALKRNVLKPMFQILKAKGITYVYNRSDNYILIGTNIYWCFGAVNESSQDVLQGMTAAGALLDDASVMPKNFVDQAITRCSVEGSKIFMNLNPSNPHHYLKTDYIDLAEEKEILVIHFTLDDNLTLAESIKERLKRMFTGLWYKRYILGLWVVAEGAVYDMFREDVGHPESHVVTSEEIPWDHLVRYWVGVDYGTTNPTVYLLLGQAKDGTVYVIREYRWDSKQKGRQKSDEQYAEDFIDWIGNARYKDIWIDPSAASFGLALRNKGITRVKKADNSVIDGIRNVSTLLSAGLLKINEDCEGLIKEMSSYSWDSKAEERGEDKPLKVDDHACLHGDSIINTDQGNKKIKNIRVGDKVLTRNGYRKVQASEPTGIRKLHKLKAGDRELLLTDDHPIYTLNRGFIASSELIPSDILCILKENQCEKKDITKASLFGDTQTPNIYQTVGILSHLQTQKLTGKTFSIGQFGLSITGQFPKDTKSIMPTAIQPTTELKTLKWFRQKSTPKYMNNSLPKSRETSEPKTFIRSDTKHLNGTHRKRVGNGIPKTLKRHGKIKKKKRQSASYVEKSLKPHSQADQNIAQILASLNIEETKGLTTKKELVRSVEKFMSAINIANVDFVQGAVLQPTATKTEVYNLSVEGDHEYFANGILTHNCDALRYPIRMIFPGYCKPYLKAI